MRRSFAQWLSSGLGVGASSIFATQSIAAPAVRPRFVLCVLGEWNSLEPVAAVVNAFDSGFTLDREYSILKRDARMQSSFAVSTDRVKNTFTKDDERSVKRHNTVAYVLSGPIDQDKALKIAGSALELTARLINAGSTAVKMESAGIAHGKAHWLSLAQKATSASALERIRVLQEAWVKRPIEDGDIFYSIGMHVLGQPDIECVTGNMQPLETVRWMDALGHQLLTSKVRNKQFSPDTQSADKNLRPGPCTRYEEDDFQFNPYGYMRLG